MVFRILSACMVSVFISFILAADGHAADYIRYQEPEFLTFEELVELSKNPEPKGELGEKLKRFWVTPIISNEAYYSGARRKPLESAELGRFMRVASWNIEKSFNVEEAIGLLTSKKQFLEMADIKKVRDGSELYWKIMRQRDRIAETDILILQEMDIGHKRSGYLNAAGEIAKAMNMNYAYGAQQLEIDPLYLGTEKAVGETGVVDLKMSEYFKTDPARYKGVFGCAVLSRYPIKRVDAFQLKSQAYDWYKGEIGKPAVIEKVRRLGTRFLFKNEVTRELKVGGRIFFRVDLDVPELPEQTLTVINVHLEIKCLPKAREEQMAEILGYIAPIKNPVILMGDYNAAPTDISSTNLRRIATRTAKNPASWLNIAVNYMTPYAPVNTARGISNVTKNIQDPMAKHIPIVAPNVVKPMFDMIQGYRFLDGGAFDFRGNKERSMNEKSKVLANSNERDLKGFKTTFQVKRPIGPVIGKLRLDWCFVKSYITDPTDITMSYKFAPHFGETLEEMHTNLKYGISDHHPNVVDLPFEEPPITAKMKSGFLSNIVSGDLLER